MTQADSVSGNANPAWACLQPGGAAEDLKWNKARAGVGRKATYTACLPNARPTCNEYLARSHIYLNQHDMFLGGEISHFLQLLNSEPAYYWEHIS